MQMLQKKKLTVHYSDNKHFYFKEAHGLTVSKATRKVIVIPQKDEVQIQILIDREPLEQMNTISIQMQANRGTDVKVYKGVLKPAVLQEIKKLKSRSAEEAE